MPSLTQTLRTEYQDMFDSCRIRAERTAEVEKLVDRITSSQPRYSSVGSPLGIPWYFVGSVHCLECSLQFDRHLHNGDPLTARTVQYPPGRPLDGNPPFSWEASAADALKFEKLQLWTDWTTPGILYRLEAFNGFGYRARQTPSPYLWGFSEHYVRGKFIADGTFSQTAVSKQCGAAVLLRRMAERGIIRFDVAGNPVPDVHEEEDVENLLERFEPLLRFSDHEASDIVRQLQEALNRIPGIFLKIDGVPGPRTSEAFKKLTGHYLPGDPRNP